MFLLIGNQKKKGKINSSCTNECSVIEDAVVHGRQDKKCQSQIVRI